MSTTLVYGPPCSGKSTYVKANASPEDIIIDADALAQALGSGSHHSHPGPAKALAGILRDHALREASRLGYRVWYITSSANAPRTVPHDEAVLLDPGLAACLQRVVTDKRPAWTTKAIYRFYETQETVGTPRRHRW